jgi:glyoxylase I family protein
MFKRIDHVEIIPRDLERTLAFYTNILGFKLKERIKVKMPPMEEVVFITLNDTMIELISIKNPVPGAQWQAGYAAIALEVDDMDKTVEFLKSKGIQIARGPSNLPTSKRAEIRDPDGLTIELRQWL